MPKGKGGKVVLTTSVREGCRKEGASGSRNHRTEMVVSREEEEEEEERTHVLSMWKFLDRSAASVEVGEDIIIILESTSKQSAPLPLVLADLVTPEFSLGPNMALPMASDGGLDGEAAEFSLPNVHEGGWRKAWGWIGEEVSTSIS